MDPLAQPVESPQIILRPMTLNDVERVHAIDGLSFSMPWSERSYRFELTENVNSSVWVAEAVERSGKREIAGMIVVWVILDEAHIATIAVHPDFRRLGVGKRLLAKGLLTAHQRGAELAYLEVRRSNLAAQAMYLAFGFDMVGERRRYYQDNQEDALLMTLYHIDPEALKRFIA